MTKTLNTTEKIQDLITETRRNQERKGEQIVRAAREIQQKLDAVIAHIEDGYHVNGLGEIQGRGSSFDILCAQYEDFGTTLAMLDWAAKS